MSIKSTLVKTAAKSGLFLKKHSPEILTYSGIVLGVAATVTACRSTMHIDDVKKNHETEMSRVETLEKMVDNGELDDGDFTVNEAASSKQIIYMRTTVAYAKLYAPTIILTGLSIACILSAHNILQTRYTAVASAFAAVTAKFSDYRERVVAQYGEEVDQKFYQNIDTIEVTDDKGKVIETKKEQNVQTLSPTDKWFGPDSQIWDHESPDMNTVMLKSALDRAQNKLDYTGHLFLNDVYRLLGLPDTKEGAVLGWINTPDHDSIVDFGVFGCSDDPWDNVKDCPWDGKEEILLQFNCDGIVYDQI